MEDERIIVRLAKPQMANEYIIVGEIADGIGIYIQLLKNMLYDLIHNPVVNPFHLIKPIFN